jgi:DNA-binding LacI/PurR family transcriptional regulator
MRVTIRQVAERAGVSKTTVSKILVGRHERIPVHTRERVLQVVREMGYIPVRTALQNRHVPTRVIAFPIDDLLKLRFLINAETYFGICAGAVRHGYDVLTLLRTDSNWVDERKELRFLDRRSDGAIFDLSVLADAAGDLDALARHGVPTVVCYSRNVPEGVGWVDPDNRGAMYGAVSHLMANGHRRLAFLNIREPPDSATYFDKGERLRYFREAVQQYGIGECADCVFAAWYGEISPELPRQILERGATAVVCVNDRLAIDLMLAVRAGRLSVPDDLSIVGVDNVDAEQWGLTSMGFSYHDIGNRAVDALVGLIMGKPVEECRLVVPVELYKRQSVKDL